VVEGFPDVIASATGGDINNHLFSQDKKNDEILNGIANYLSDTTDSDDNWEKLLNLFNNPEFDYKKFQNNLYTILSDNKYSEDQKQHLKIIESKNSNFTIFRGCEEKSQRF
jgi:hypothetical protein